MKSIWCAITRVALLSLGSKEPSSSSTPENVNFNEALQLNLNPSPRLAGVWIVLYGGAGWVTLSMTLPWLAKLTISGLLLWQAYTAVRFAMLWQTPVLQNCTLHANDIVHLVDGKEGKITASSYFHTTCVILTVKLLHSSQSYSLIIFPDALPSAQFRLLRIRLKHVFNTKVGVF